MKLDYACDVISMFKINYTIAFHGIGVLLYTRLKVKAKSENQISSLNWVESNTSWTVKTKVYTLMCVSEEPLQYVANQNIHVARHLYVLSRDKTIDLPYDLICRTTSL